MPFDIISLTIIDNCIYISSDLSNVNANRSMNIYESPLFICLVALGCQWNRFNFVQGRQFHVLGNFFPSRARRDIFPLGANMVFGVKEMALPKNINQILEMRQMVEIN
jgi:hypothetical protein